MNTLSVQNLILWGRHGKTGDEPHIEQPFEVSITADLDLTRVFESDDLNDTIDYKDLQEIAETHIEYKSYTLLETLAGNIADEVLQNVLVKEVRVEVVKIRPKTSGIPSVVVTKVRDMKYQSLNIHNIDFDYVISELDQHGGVSVKLLTEPFRKQLLEEANRYEYEKQPEVVGPHHVREELSSVSTPFPPGSLLYKLKEQLEEMIISKMTASGEEKLFSTPLRFNEISLQLYEEGSIGITSHMDGKSAVNLICVVVLEGESRFALCEDRQGSNPYYLDTTPGNIIFMRAVGYRGSDHRPFHFVSDITTRRIVVGIRQTTKDPYAWRVEPKP